MITRNQVIRLLAIAAGGDQRTVGDDDADFWHFVATEERWHFAAARRVLVKYYSRGADKPRLTPAAVTDELRKLRGRAAESFEAPRIPDGLPNREYPAWLRAQLARHVDALVERWAATGEEPPRSITSGGSGPLPIEAAPEHLRGQIRRGIDRFGRLPDDIAREDRRPDRLRRAEAQSELDAARERTPEAGS